MALEKINGPNDIKKLTPQELEMLRTEIREYLIDTLSVTGGHLASNLGTVELTMALHLVFDLPKDQIIWDVGHQSYTHKILTGRRDEFPTLRRYGGLSGFPRREESDCDAFDTGHATTSISAGLGMVRARELNGDDYKVISVIGDGSLTGGMAYEALNNCSELKKNFIIVLNDNNMSISENVGGMSVQLSKLRTSQNYTGLKEDVFSSLEKIPVYGDKLIATIRRTKSGLKQLIIPGMIFEELGVMYLGPVDGHNIRAMEKVFREAAQVQGAVLVHVVTRKGYGFEPAERHPSRFHGAGPFDKEKGLPLVHSNPAYTDIFSTVMRKMGDRNPNVVAITAAMKDGTGLKRFANMFPDRFFDVGIAEAHAVTFAAGLAVQGLHPVVAIYSSFLQRAYDQILHDVCQQHLPVTFAVDRAGLVGADGATHQGIYDLSYLSTIPGLMIMAPKNKWELSDMMKFAVAYEGPAVIRYPKGEAYTGLKEMRAPIEPGKSEMLFDGDEILLYPIGSMVKTAVEVRSALLAEGIRVALCNARFCAPLDENFLDEACEKYSLIVPMEENAASGGFGEHVVCALAKRGYRGRTLPIALPDAFIPHGSTRILKEKTKIDATGVLEQIHEALRREES